MSLEHKKYLAEKYMSGPKADAILSRTSNKKKKRKAGATETSGFIHDESIGFGNEAKEEEEVVEAVVASDRSFKKRKMGGWETVREPTPPPAADELPQVVGVTEEATPKGGLLTAEQLRKKFAEVDVTKEDGEQQHETVYRDSSGRKIDTKVERAEAARKKREQEEKEAQKMEWGKGFVQREEKERLRVEEEKERTRGLARYADDVELNEMQKATERWNDPAATFLTKKRSKGPRKPQYTGPPPPPNRFGILPGYRWDGVDRGNGFEKKLVQHANEKKRQGLESYQWSVDDM